MQEEVSSVGKENVFFLFRASFLCLREIRKIFYEVAFVGEKMAQIEVRGPLASLRKQSFKQNAPFSMRN